MTDLDARAPDQPALTAAGILEIVAGIDLGPVLYDRPTFRVHSKGDGFLIQLVYFEVDCDNPAAGPVPQHARKWYVSAHSTPTEIVRTAHKAVMASLEHRLGEWFTYRGERVYSPHRRLVR